MEEVKLSDDLIENNLNLVKSRVKKFLHTNKEFDDLYQVGCIGLVKQLIDLTTV